jgi:hypothetical protein
VLMCRHLPNARRAEKRSAFRHFTSKSPEEGRQPPTGTRSQSYTVRTVYLDKLPTTSLAPSSRGREAALAIQRCATNDNLAAKPGSLQPRTGLAAPQGNPLRGRAPRGLDRRLAQRALDLGRDEETARQPNQETLKYKGVQS